MSVFMFTFENNVLATSYFPLASIIASDGLNFCVRNGNRCIPADKSPGHYFQRMVEKRKAGAAGFEPDTARHAVTPLPYAPTEIL